MQSDFHCQDSNIRCKSFFVKNIICYAVTLKISHENFLSMLYIKHLKILLVTFHYPSPHLWENSSAAKYLASNRTGSEKWSSLKSFRELCRPGSKYGASIVRRNPSHGTPYINKSFYIAPSRSAQEKLRLCIDPWRLLQSQIVKCSRKFSRVPSLLPELIFLQTSKKSRNIQNKFNRVLFRVQRRSWVRT